MAQKARNAGYTKEYNQKSILRILRRQPMSRAELARATGLTRAATSLIAEELLGAGVLTELAPQSVGRGRCATPLALRKDSYYALAVDLARKGCTVGLCDIAGNLLQCRPVPDREAMLDAIAAELQALAAGIDREKLLGIGISAPGPVDSVNGRILNPPKFERWHGVEIGKRLSDALGLPACLEHDVSAMALHQLEAGESRNFLLLFIDIGIGAAIVSDGKLLGGSRGFTGELGHTTIRFDGRQCACGSRGCLETYASIPAMLEDTPFQSWADFIDHTGTDPSARNRLDREARYLSAGLVNLLNLVPLDSIYLAGDICYRCQPLIRQLHREINAKALYRKEMNLQIAPVAQSPNFGVLAAAEVVFSRFLTV